MTTKDSTPGEEAVPGAVADKDPSDSASYVDSEDAANASTATTDKPEGAPEAEDALDLSFLDDNAPETLGPKLTKEEAEYLNRRGMRRDKFTQARQADRQEVKDLEPDAERWRTVATDPAKRRRMLAILDEVDDDPVEVEGMPTQDEADEMTGSELLAVAQRVSLANAQAAEERGAQRAIAEIQKPALETQALNDYANKWAIDNDVDDETILAVGKDLQDTYKEDLSVGILERCLEKEVNKYRDVQALKARVEGSESTSERQARARTASPRGGVGVSAPNLKTHEESLPDDHNREDYVAAVRADFLQRAAKIAGKTVAEVDATD